jgi:hypothetical protein
MFSSYMISVVLLSCRMSFKKQFFDVYYNGLLVMNAWLKFCQQVLAHTYFKRPLLPDLLTWNMTYCLDSLVSKLDIWCKYVKFQEHLLDFMVPLFFFSGKMCYRLCSLYHVFFFCAYMAVVTCSNCWLHIWLQSSYFIACFHVLCLFMIHSELCFEFRLSEGVTLPLLQWPMWLIFLLI